LTKRIALIFLIAAIVVSVLVLRTRSRMRHPRGVSKLLQSLDPGFSVTPGTLAEGERLSQTQCGTCHVRPEPGVLPKLSWEEVFTELDRSFRESGILVDEDGKRVPPDASPKGPGGLSLPGAPYKNVKFTRRDFAKIAHYYLERAPVKSLPQENRPADSPQAAPFRVKYASPAAKPGLIYNLAVIDEKGGQIIYADGSGHTFIVVDPTGETRRIIPLPGAATGLARRPDGWYATIMGPDMFPTSEALGSVVRLPAGIFDGQPGRPETIIAGLRRPVRTTFADFNGDKTDEMLVEEFGFSEGGLTLFTRQQQGGWAGRPLLDMSGTVGALPHDFDGDGKTDIAALVAQSNEGLYLLKNQVSGHFVTETVAKQQPGFGSNSLTLADMNGDGNPDLIVGNGDNLDLMTYPMKNYHGIRIFAGNGKGGFAQSYFYPMNGVIQALPADFDGDGDTDIVGIAYYVDFNRLPLETLVYLENTGRAGGFSFLPHRIPGTEKGRWVSLAAGDFDHDGDSDLALAAAYPEFLDRQWPPAVAPRPGFMILENTTR
jgi:hypothetical protein